MKNMSFIDFARLFLDEEIHPYQEKMILEAIKSVDEKRTPIKHRSSKRKSRQYRKIKGRTCRFIIDELAHKS